MDASDALVLTSLLGGTNPVIAKPPQGDGQELDPVTGVITTGQYTIDIADPVIAGSSPPQRVVTSQLFDSAGRQLLLSRRTYIEASGDGGSTWAAVIAGYMMNYQLGDAITWTFSVGDTRRIQNTLQVFDGTSFGARGALFGGPLVGGPWGPINARGGWTCKVEFVFAKSAGHYSATVGVSFVNGYRGINDPVSTRYSDFLGTGGLIEQVNQAAQGYYSSNVPVVPAASGYFGTIDSGYGGPGFPGITLRIAEYLASANNGLFIPSWVPIATGTPAGSGPPWMLNAISGNQQSIGMLNIMWPDGLATPSVGTVLHIAAYTSTPSDVSPVYLDMHPVDLAVSLYTQAGIAFDIPSAAVVETLLGSTLRVALRIPATTNLQNFLETVLFGPFGFSTRTNSAGVLEFFSTRLKSATPPTVTIGTADLQDASGVVFENDEATVYSSVRIQSKVFFAYAPNTQTDTNSRPLDSVIEADTQVVITNADANAFVTQEVVYAIPGLIHDVSGQAQDMTAYCSAVALEIFDRFGRGGPVCDALAVLASSDTGFNVGDELLIQPAHFPNKNYRLLDNPSVGPRIMQILRRSETPAGPLVKVIDAGSNVVPASPAAVITIGASTGSPRTVATFTITNAAAINATGTLITAVQVGTGASAPTNGMSFARYAAGLTPTGGVQLPPMAPGTTVWARARTETAGGLPSAWTAWVSQTLTAISFVTGLGVSPVYQNAAQVNWTVANATDLVDVYVFQGSSPPADWSMSFVGTLLPNTTSILLRNLAGPTIAYQVAVAHRDPSTGIPGVLVTTSLTTNSGSIGTAPTPAAFKILPTTQDGSRLSGITLALYAANPIYDFVIERAPDASGSPGTFAEIADVAGSSQYFTDWLPQDGVIRWYRVKGRLSGETDSAYLAAQSAIPGAVVTVQPGAAQLVPVTSAPVVVAPLMRVPYVYSSPGAVAHVVSALCKGLVEYEVWGAGGGTPNTNPGGGGGGGAYAWGSDLKNPGDTIALIVGTGAGAPATTPATDSSVNVTDLVGGAGQNGDGSGGGGAGGAWSSTLPASWGINGGPGGSDDSGNYTASQSGLSFGGDSPRGGQGAVEYGHLASASTIGFPNTTSGDRASTAPGGGGAGQFLNVVWPGQNGMIIVWEYQ